MPRMIDKVTGKLIEELDYTPEGIKRGQQMASENENIVMEKTQQYQVGGLVRPSYQVGGLVSPSNLTRKRIKTRGTGAALRGLDFYEV